MHILIITGAEQNIHGHLPLQPQLHSPASTWCSHQIVATAWTPAAA